MARLYSPSEESENFAVISVGQKGEKCYLDIIKNISS